MNKLPSFWYAAFVLFIFSCKKDNAEPPAVHSNLIPLKVGNYWKYKFFYKTSDSTYNTDAANVEMKIVERSNLPDGRNALLMTTKFEWTTDTTYLANDGADLVFYKVFNQDIEELFRLKEPLAVNKTWVAKNGKDTTRVVTTESITTAIGNYSNVLVVRQFSEIPHCSCIWVTTLQNTYWIKQGVGTIKQDIYSRVYGLPFFSNYNYGLYELKEFRTG